MQTTFFETTSAVLAFTGHRPNKLGGWRDDNPMATWVRLRMRQEIERLKPIKIISGMALGVDQWAAEIALEAKIHLIAAVPCEGQESKWPAHKQRHYIELLKLAQEVKNVTPGPYTDDVMSTRNRWMVDNCSIVCAVWNGSDGGTANCVAYAKKSRRPIIYIDPSEWAAAT